jgi:membrane-associated phospholipid phosphatase
MYFKATRPFALYLFPAVILGGRVPVIFPIGSREFHFGFLKGGVFYGWPSSHTTVAFAMAAAIRTLYPSSKVVRCVALLFALYIGVGVSMTIHWFSDFVAGAIIGAAIGMMTVGNIFKKRLLSSERRPL